MDLKNLIRPQLWNEISNSYIAENYRVAILDAMRYLSKIIREKSGLDGDGTPLVHQAFGGNEPKLRLNKLQTQSEKDEQKGIQFIISGLYSAIRNPRTHEDIQDNKNTADPIVYFINYVSNLIDVAKPPFAVEDFLPRVFDADFVQSKIYAQELVKEIPKNKYFETLIEIYRKKSNGTAGALALVFREILEKLTDTEISEFMSVVSAELDVVSDADKIIKIIRILPNQYWPMVKLTARMRIENKLIASILIGETKLKTGGTPTGALGTWASNIIDQFTLKEELTNAIIKNLTVHNYQRNRYTLIFFLSYFPSLIKEPHKYKICALAMKRLVKINDKYSKDKLRSFLEDCPEDWFNVIRDEFSEWSNLDEPEFYLRDGSSFLGNVPYEDYEESEEEEFPF